MQRKPLIAGNWKMFGRRADLAEIEALAPLAAASRGSLDVLICPPAFLVALAADRFKSGAVLIGAQDCHAGADGAFTGNQNAAMMADAGATYCILGHSERRRDHGEKDAHVAEKAKAVLAAGMAPIVCVGESLEERKAGKAIEIVRGQLAASLPDGAPASLVVAYEPVWAIGTGLTPTTPEIAEMHAAIRAALVARFGDAGRSMRVLYGGSVKPGNAAEIFSAPDVDGALVGGASLKAADFSQIIKAHPRAVG